MLRKNNLCIETMNGLLIIDGWEFKDQHWNGWSIPFFGKEAADAIAEEIGLTYDAETDTYTDTEQSAGDNRFESWRGGFNEEVGEKVYPIGAASWCWSITDDEEMKSLKMNIIDRRTK